MNTARPRGILPALFLFVSTPLIAEYLLGSLSFAQIAALPILCFLYGSGAVLIREAARTGQRGWPTVLVLGTAYGILEEGIATQSLFNPHYLHLTLLDYGHIAPLGMGAWWTLYVIALHVVWSVCVPIALTEALFPAAAESPWLGVKMRSLFGVFLLVGLVGVTSFSRRSEQFLASPWQLGATAACVLVLVIVGLRWRPFASVKASSGSSPSLWAVGAFALVAGSAFELIEQMKGYGWPWEVGFAARLAVLGLAIVVIWRWSRRDGWSKQHRAALAVGGVLVYCWWGYSVEVRLHGTSGLIPHSILVGLAIIAVIVALFRSSRTREVTA